MLRFSMKVSVMVLLIVLTNLAFYCLLPSRPDSGSYLAAINDKHARLANTPAPRIILVGSSELAFGIDSARIEESLKMPVVNMGLQGALGRRLELEAIRPHIQAGDIIIVSGYLDGIVDSGFYGIDDGTGLHLWLLKYRPELFSAMNTPRHWLLLVQEYPSFIRTMLTIGSLTGFQEFYPRTPSLQVPYRRAGFNEYGDLVAHLDLPARPWLSSPTFAGTDPIVSAETYFNDFHTFVRQQGARIYRVPPPVAESITSRAAQQPNTDRKLLGLTIPSLGTNADYVYPDEYFFDGPGHLNRTGRAVRTGQLIQALTDVVGQSLQPVLDSGHGTQVELD